jgi:hypothetical protein
VTTPLIAYVVAWTTFCVVAAAIAVRSVRVNLRDAIGFMRVPWKMAVFVPAIIFVTFAGRYTDDETWDLVTGGGMSILTASTAWWSVGTAVRVVRRMAKPRELVVALAVMFFSSSWFYDGYLLLRDGAYTSRWVGNLMLSPTIYLCAGLVANLESREGSLAFAFTRKDWPRAGGSSRVTWSMALAAVPLIVIAGWFLVGAVGWNLPGH